MIQHPRTLDVQRRPATSCMTALTRLTKFVSHTNPEDNGILTWLGSRLTTAGYEVRADVLGLCG